MGYWVDCKCNMNSYDKTTAMRSIADEWVAQVRGKKRASKSIVTKAAKGARGIAAMPVLKWSIAETEREQTQPNPIKPLSERVFQHEAECAQCHNMRRKQTILQCRLCPRVMHNTCAGLQTAPRSGWLCYHHHCRECGRSAADAGGLLFRCVCCPYSYCDAVWLACIESS